MEYNDDGARGIFHARFIDMVHQSPVPPDRRGTDKRLYVEFISKKGL